MEDYQKKQQGEDTEPHERLGLRVNDEAGREEADLDQTGAIQENDQEGAFS
ncbi:hypothetical protein [Gorillibacterium sp. sgz5001074]|uniref:hypothetical protein n=1 Tax=Gorillibacterium sp. sgz5001074 TaxID=3446695 RepID=UPI003F677C5B